MTAPPELAIEPVLPDYAGPNVRGLIPALLAPAHAPMPAWMPTVVAEARQVVLLVLDGLGWEQLQERRASWVVGVDQRRTLSTSPAMSMR